MPITYYDTVNGQLIGETTGGVRTEYLTDALGSVTATVNSSGEIVNTYRYKPYGQLLSKTGSGEDPRYLWTGNTGSRRTLVTYAEQYNQARHYGSKQAGWTTRDRFWPQIEPFGYVRGRRTTWLDPLGLDGTPGCLTLRDFPLAEIPPISLKAAIDVCGTCFNTKCCPLDSATMCVDGSLSAALELELPIEIIDDIVKGVSDAEKLLLRGVYGLFGLVSGCAFSVPGCHEKEPFHFRITFSIGACLVFGSYECTWDPPKGPDCGFKTGYCGTPSIYFQLNGTFGWCS